MSRSLRSLAKYFLLIRSDKIQKRLVLIYMRHYHHNVALMLTHESILENKLVVVASHIWLSNTDMLMPIIQVYIQWTMPFKQHFEYQQSRMPVIFHFAVFGIRACNLVMPKGRLTNSNPLITFISWLTTLFPAYLTIHGFFIHNVNIYFSQEKLYPFYLCLYPWRSRL